jgi:hypothetical protein
LLDLGGKAEGSIDRSELPGLAPGDEIEAWVVWTDGVETRLSTRLAGATAAAFLEQAMEAEIRSTLPALAPTFGAGIPKELIAANRAMNSAYAFVAAELSAAPDLSVPFLAAGLGPVAKELIGLTEVAEADGQRDGQLIEAWAQVIGLGGWYTWQQS